VRDYLDSLDGQIQVSYLPPYAPEINPVEYLRGWLRRHALANVCPGDLDQLHATARSKLRGAQRRASIISACWAQVELW
jgi:transposase